METDGTKKRKIEIQEQDDKSTTEKLMTSKYEGKTMNCYVDCWLGDGASHLLQGCNDRG